MLEARVEMWLQSKLANHRVVVAVDVGVDSIHALEDLADKAGECLGEGDAWCRLVSCVCCISKRLTNLAWHKRFVVNGGLHPSHELFYVGRGCHLCRLLVVVVILPQVLEPAGVISCCCKGSYADFGSSYSSVAFISGHECGEQNSVMAP